MVRFGVGEYMKNSLIDVRTRKHRLKTGLEVVE